MIKVDVAIQSYKKPESLIYTLLSLKKYCGKHIDTIYINDDCSGSNIIDYYNDPKLIKIMSPIKIKTRINIKASGYTHTIVTKEMISKKKLVNKIQLLLHFVIKRAKYYTTSDDVRYQWAFNNTNKKYLFLIHDDIKFYDDVLGLYIKKISSDDTIAIVGDLGGSKRCPYGPCFKKCSPKKIMKKDYPSSNWPITGSKNCFYKMLGRYNRNCRINEWCCLINVDISNKLKNTYGIYFGNYEGGGDVGTFWFDKIIKLGYNFIDPLPTPEERKKYYLHWWQGYEGHSVWVKNIKYEENMVIEQLEKEFNYHIKKGDNNENKKRTNN